MRGVWPLMAVVLLLATATSGCFDVEFAREMFVPPEEMPEPPVNQWHNITHQFVTALNDPSSAIFTQVEPVPTYNETIYIDIVIKASFPELPDVNNQTLRDLIENLTIERYIEVTVFSPNGSKYSEFRTNKTTAHPVQLKRVEVPGEGEWKVKVEASGIGIQAIEVYDTLNVKVRVNGPIPEEAL